MMISVIGIMTPSSSSSLSLNFLLLLISLTFVVVKGNNYDDDDYDNNTATFEEADPIFLDYLQITIFSLLCYPILYGPFLFTPKAKRTLARFQLDGQLTEAIIIKTTKATSSCKEGCGSSAIFSYGIVVHFTNSVGTRIEKEIPITKELHQSIEQEGTSVMNIYIFPQHPMSAFGGDTSFLDYSVRGLVASLGSAVVFGFTGIYALYDYLARYAVNGGFVLLFLIHIIGALLSYWGMWYFDYDPKFNYVFYGGDVIDKWSAPNSSSSSKDITSKTKNASSKTITAQDIIAQAEETQHQC